MIALTLLIPTIVFVASGGSPLDGVDAIADGAMGLLILWIPMLWIGLAVAAKRLHDRGKSAWWLLPFYALPAVLDGIGSAIGGIGLLLSLASMAISIWALIELGFLRGTPGANAYGPDPLGAQP